jgi:hypothetical protein
MEDKINKYNNNPDYDAGYQQGWEDAINYAIQTSKDMKDNKAYYDTKTLDELEQRIV